MRKRYLIMGLILSITILLSSCQSIFSLSETITGKECEIKLYDAIVQGNLEMAKEAIEEGSNLDSNLDTKLNPLFQAMSYGRLSIIQLLLEKGANPNFVDKSGLPLLAYTAGAKKWGVNDDNVVGLKYCEMLIKSGADINQTAKNGYSPLDFAIKYANMNNDSDQIIEFLLTNGAAVTKKTVDAVNETIKHNICNYKRAEEILTIAHNNDISLGLSECLEAVILKDYAKANELIKSKKFKNSDLINIAFFPAYNGSIQTLQLLADSKQFDIKSVDGKGNTILIIASETSNLDLAKLCIYSGVDINLSNFDGETALTKAIDHDNYKLSKYLLDNNATTYDLSGDAETNAIINAIKTGDIKLIDLILSKYPIDEQKKYDCLSEAVSDNKFDVLKHFASLGYQLTKCPTQTNLIEDACGFSDNPSIDVIKYLVESKVNINGYLNDSTPLSDACQNGYIEIAKFLIKNGANVNPKTDEWNTPLYYSITYGRLDSVKLLLENGAKLTEKSLEAAKEKGSNHIYNYLLSIKTHGNTIK